MRDSWCDVEQLNVPCFPLFHGWLPMPRMRAAARSGVPGNMSSLLPCAILCITKTCCRKHLLPFMSCSHLERTFWVDETSPNHTTSDTLWSCVGMTSLARAFLAAPWHSGSLDRVANTCFFHDEAFLSRVDRMACDETPSQVLFAALSMFQLVRDRISGTTCIRTF